MTTQPKPRPRKPVLTTRHPEWRVFVSLLSKEYDEYGCIGDLPLTRKVLRNHFKDVSHPRTLQYLKHHFGWCDCEVLTGTIRTLPTGTRKLFRYRDVDE